MTMKVKKRNGNYEDYDLNKIWNAVTKAYKSCNYEYIGGKVEDDLHSLCDDIATSDAETIDVEEIQDHIEAILFDHAPMEVAKAYMLYRERHKESRAIKDRLDYMQKYVDSGENAATSSETDANANVTIKNVANLEGEVYKSNNRLIHRQRMKDKLNELFPEVAKQYEEDLNNNIIYAHDESCSPSLKNYCMAATLYPLMLEGTGNVDGITPSPPNDIQSFSGQVTNLVFLLSSQVRGAVALGDYFIALNYYVVKEFGDNWHNKLDLPYTTEYCNNHRTIKDAIRKGMKTFIYGVNQPAGNRSYNSPFSNCSYYDKNYFKALFDGFQYPDGTEPKWEHIDTLQRIFMELHRELRLIKPLTYPVTTIALLHDGKDVLDQEYKELCAEEWAKGGSFFLYMNDNPSALASCCRVLNEVQENTFSSTLGAVGLMTGSCNVITLNFNRIVQDYFRSLDYDYDADPEGVEHLWKTQECKEGLKKYLITILERVYKYQIAFKEMLYDMEDAGMYSSSNAGYIYTKKLYSTIGLLGYFEASQFLGLDVIKNTEEYVEFLKLILGTVKEQNKIHSINDKKRPHRFNSEAVPGENLGVKFYERDKKDGYYVPLDQNLYNCYFYSPWSNQSVLKKLSLHGRNTCGYCDGGQSCHINLQEDLTKEQYLKIIDYAISEGVNYFTFNVPFSECKDCGNVEHVAIKKCPKCGSENIDWWVRVIGYLRPVSAFSNPRQIEHGSRVYNKTVD